MLGVEHGGAADPEFRGDTPVATGSGVRGEAAARPRLRWRAIVLLLLASLSLLGEGERFRIDPRFKTPSATIFTYWRALRFNDVQTVQECFSEPSASLPFPGMLWFLPPVDDMNLNSMRLVSAESGHLIAMYEVQFKPAGTELIQSFLVSTELQRVGHEWRIVPPSGDSGLPTWQTYRGAVDI
jgi:hypothetical protein